MDRDCPRAWSSDSRTEGVFDVLVVRCRLESSYAMAPPDSTGESGPRRTARTIGGEPPKAAVTGGR